MSENWEIGLESTDYSRGSYLSFRKTLRFYLNFQLCYCLLLSNKGAKKLCFVEIDIQSFSSEIRQK